MPAGTWDLHIEQGATLTQTYQCTGDDGMPTDWTGWTPQAQIRTAATPTATLLLDLGPYLTVAADTITLNVPATATATLDRNGRWDLEMHQDDATVTRLLHGQAIVSPEVTR